MPCLLHVLLIHDGGNEAHTVKATAHKYVNVRLSGTELRCAVCRLMKADLISCVTTIDYAKTIACTILK